MCEHPKSSKLKCSHIVKRNDAIKPLDTIEVILVILYKRALEKKIILTVFIYERISVYIDGVVFKNNSCPYI